MMSQGVARILLCGILSDTINLMSPTTTDADRIALVMLTAVARVDDLDLVVRYYMLCYYERATETSYRLETLFSSPTSLYPVFLCFALS